MSEQWRSPRSIQAELAEKKRQRFEEMMELADDPAFPDVTRELALQALKDEDTVLLWVKDGSGTFGQDSMQRQDSV